MKTEETPLQKANEEMDKSMSTVVLAASALATIADTILSGDDVNGYVKITSENATALEFLASHFYQLVKAHVALWDGYAELREGTPHAPA